MRERNIENEILKQNKIPGCDQLTRPEEVKALSKYLKSIRTTQENHTFLEKDNLELPGRTTGRIPEINSLEDHVEGLDGIRGVKNLYKESSRISLSDDQGEKIPTGLYTEKSRENLEDKRKISLENKREDLKNTLEDPKLEKHRENLDTDSSGIDELNKEKVNLEGVRDVRNLYINTKEKLKVPEEDLKLGKEKESLINNHNPELDLTRIDLEGFRDLSYKEQLEVDSKNELDTTRISLKKTTENPELSNHKEDLKKTPEELDKLGSYKESLGNVEDKLEELNGTKVKLRNPVSDIELSKTKVSLERTAEDKELETYRENLKKTPEELDKLENHKESLRSGEELENLPKDKIALEGIAEILEELGNTRIDLDGTEESEISTLEDYRENLSVEDNNSLEDERIDLGGTIDYETSELEDARISLTGTEEFEPRSLEDKRIDLEDTKESEPKALEDERIDLNGTKESEISTLEDYRENLSIEDNNSLEDTRIDLTGTKEAEVSELEDYLDELDNTKDYEASELEDTRIDLTGTKEAEPESLEDERIDLEGTEEFEPGSLEDFIDKIEDTRDLELEDEKLELPETSGDGYEGYTPLGPDELDSLGGNINNFYDSLLEIPETDDAPRQSGDYTPLGPEELDSLGGNLGNFYDSILEIPEDTEHTIEELDDTSLDLPEIAQKAPRELGDYNYLSPEEVEKIIENPTYFYNQQKEIPETDNGNYLSPEEVEKIIENPTYFYNQQEEVPEAQAPQGQEIYKYSENPELSKILVDGLAYKNHETTGKTIRAKAEAGDNGNLTIGGIVGDIIGDKKGNPNGKHGKERQKELNTCLKNLTAERDALEIIKGTWRSRLPGNNSGVVGDLVSGGIGGMVDGIVDNVVDSAKENIGNAIFGDNFMEIDISNPLNRPDSLLDKGMDAIEGIFGKNDKDGWTAANNRITSSMPDSANIYATSKFSEAEKELHSNITGESSEDKGGSFWKKVGNVAKDIVSDTILGKGSNYKLKANYLSGKGIETTLEELCGKSVSEVSTLNDLYTILKQSPYLTTPDKFTSAEYSGYRVQTLDSNAFWEVVLEPYAGPENGDLNYLPGIHEINIRNIVTHGVNTAYNKWIPFTGFDLQKSKLTNKTLSLYDGEISYPISMEFTNELRLTIADDQYKSWKRYFEECAKAAVYNSEGHDSMYYLYPAKNRSDYTLTAIDTNNVCIAMYKNICFRCLIYISTPQYSNIQKFDLLLVMKDFSEEYTGDVDGGAGDLTVSFSIVGENPAGVEGFTRKFLAKNVASYDKKETSSDYTSILSGGINAVGKLIK